MMSFLAVSIALGQQTITGSVSDEDGAPLPGASIVEVGTNNGVVADFDGNFSISVGVMTLHYLLVSLVILLRL